MYNVSAVQRKIKAAKKAISKGQKGLAWKMMEVKEAYIREFPDQAFTTFEEMSMAVDVLGVLIEYYVHEGRKGEAYGPMLEMSKMVDDVMANAPFTEEQKGKLNEQLSMYREVFDNDSTCETMESTGRNYDRVIKLSDELMEAVNSKDRPKMLALSEELDAAYKEEYGDSIDSYEAFYAFCKMHLAAARYCSFNNMYGKTQEIVVDVKTRFEGFKRSKRFSKEQVETVECVVKSLEEIGRSTPQKHRNLVIGRNDTRCCLCRNLPANKTGSHIVPNFLAHPTFSWDGKGKRGHEALNHAFLNEMNQFCTFYGQDVPEWRFAQGEGKKSVTEEDIEKNINQLEFDNEFCSGCENRFGVLETAYSQYYNGQKKKINPRVAYLFWMSVLWRMSMGSMSIFMDINDELPLRELLDKNMLGTEKEIAESKEDLGEWRYAIFRAIGLRDGDKGILGARMEEAPYVVSYNDLVMVFFNHEPSDEELEVGPIKVKRENLCDWRHDEKSEEVDRRWFWDVRDWFVSSSYAYRDPVRERALRKIREHERSTGKVVPDDAKEIAIKAARIAEGPQPERMYKFHKMERIFIAHIKKKEAEEKGQSYDPLSDEDLFLTERDFQLYYEDMAAYARETGDEKVKQFPFYKEAREAIKDEACWSGKSASDDKREDKFAEAFGWLIDQMSPEELLETFPFLERKRTHKAKGQNEKGKKKHGRGKH